MKLYEYIVEDKAEHLLGQFGTKIGQAAKKDRFASNYIDEVTPISIINYFKQQLGNKYLQWVVRQYASGDFKLEDVSRVKQALKQFQQKQRVLPIKDINQYRSVADLEDAVEDTEEVKSKRQQKQEIKTEGADVVMKGSDGTVVKLKTKEAACYYGKGTKWCTAANNNNMFDEYNDEGPLYVFIGNDGRKFQFHFRTDQFMDEQDNDVDPKQIRAQYPTLDKFLVDEGDDEILDLLYHEMFEEEDIIRYIQTFIGDRWPEVEPYIMKDPAQAREYAIGVIKGRWPEAEPYIMKDPGSAYYYATGVIEGRWPQAEPYIMKDPNFAAAYAIGVIKGRWPEAEPYIATRKYAAMGYVENVIRGNWARLEPNRNYPQWDFWYELDSRIKGIDGQKLRLI